MIRLIFICICLIAASFAGSLNASPVRATTVPDPVLPAPKVTDLRLQKTSNRVFIQWHVEANQSAGLFEIEKSRDGKNFTLAAVVFGTENAEKNNYWFYDRDQKKSAYYRIKIISGTGEESYSVVVKK